MQDSETWLARWRSAGLLDDATAAAIRAYEESHVKPSSRRWQVLVALIFGAILLGAGVLLFVAAHWDRLSPLARMLLVLAMLVFFHGLGILTRSRFAGFATAMHGVDTLSAGAAIALVGQIFNMQEHWPSAVIPPGTTELILRDRGKTAEPSATQRSVEKHFQERSAELQIPRLRSG